MKVQEWSEISTKEISESEIRSSFQSSQGYRLFPNRYHSEPEFFRDFMWPVRIYVISGKCTYRANSESIEVCAGQFVDLPAGRHGIQPGENGVSLMQVYHIPKLADQ